MRLGLKNSNETAALARHLDDFSAYADDPRTWIRMAYSAALRDFDAWRTSVLEASKRLSETTIVAFDQTGNPETARAALKRLSEITAMLMQTGSAYRAFLNKSQLDDALQKVSSQQSAVSQKLIDKFGVNAAREFPAMDTVEIAAVNTSPKRRWVSIFRRLIRRNVNKPDVENLHRVEPPAPSASFLPKTLSEAYGDPDLHKQFKNNPRTGAKHYWFHYEADHNGGFLTMSITYWRNDPRVDFHSDYYGGPNELLYMLKLAQPIVGKAGSIGHSQELSPTDMAIGQQNGFSATFVIPDIVEIKKLIIAMNMAVGRYKQYLVRNTILNDMDLGEIFYDLPLSERLSRLVSSWVVRDAQESKIKSLVLSSLNRGKNPDQILAELSQNYTADSQPDFSTAGNRLQKVVPDAPPWR